MVSSIPHGARSTANQVIAGVDLTRKWILVTGCDEEIGFETMNALAANGAHIFGLASSLASAKSACDQIGPRATPIACDLADLDSVAAAVEMVRGLQVSLDAIIANAEVANPPTLRRRYGVELQFLVNHIGHFALVNRLLDRVRNGTGRIVIVSNSASVMQAPPEGIMFDNLDGHRFYDPMTFYGQSKLAVALYAKELSRRLRQRAIAVNSLHSGAMTGTGLRKELLLPLRIVRSTVQLFMKSASQRAATGVLLASSPCVTGITGEYWSDCQIAEGNPLLNDSTLAQRLWQVSMQIVRRVFCGRECSPNIVIGDICHREIEATKIDRSGQLSGDARFICGDTECLSSRVRGKPHSQRPEPRAVCAVRERPSLRPAGAQVPVSDSGTCIALYAQSRRC